MLTTAFATEVLDEASYAEELAGEHTRDYHGNP